MSAWIWETTPVHLDFDSDRYCGEIIEPVSGEMWTFDLPRYAEVTVSSPDEQRTTRIPIHPDTTEAEELEDGIRITLDHEGVRCVFEMTLDSAAPEIVCTVREIPAGSRRILSAVFPGALSQKGSAAMRYWTHAIRDGFTGLFSIWKDVSNSAARIHPWPGGASWAGKARCWQSSRRISTGIGHIPTR
ncbi:MAG: hypothetical protein ABIH23_17720 [bacterium]